MASLVEDSVTTCSIPIPDLSQLQAHLHTPCEPSSANRRAPLEIANATSQSSQGEPLKSRSQHGPVLDNALEIITSTNVLETDNPPQIATRRPPRLHHSRTAPTPIMDVTISQSPSHEGTKALAKAESFAGFPGGDTQPMDTQVYRDYTTSMINISLQETPINARVDYNDKISAHTAFTERSPHTYTEGDTGFVDLGLESRPASPTPRSQGSADMDDLLENSPQTQFQMPESPSKQRMPQTPPIAGNKRDRDGNILASNPTTTKKMLGLSELFGGTASNGAVLSTTQLFDQTQAHTSPIPDAARSDPVMSRPSPNMHQSLSRSSPPNPTTSPFPLMPGRLSSSARGARDTYGYMHGSQTRKLAQFGQESSIPEYMDGWDEGTERDEENHGDDSNDNDNDDDEDEDSMARKYNRQRARELLSKKAQSDWARVRAPSRHGSRPTPSRKPTAKTTIDLVTPARDAEVQFEMLSSDQASNANLSDAEYNDVGHTEHTGDEPVDSSTGSHHSNDFYDELGQTVLRSQASDADEEIRSSHGGADLGMEEAPCEDAEAVAEGNYANEYAILDAVPGHSAKASFGKTDTQRSAIASSQRDQHVVQRSSLTRPLSMPSPRSSYVVPGSQYTGKTSEEQAPYSSSQWKKVAGISSAQDDVEAVPSSPPVPVGDGTLPEESPFAHGMSSMHNSGRAKSMQPEIPESDIPEPAEIKTDLGRVQTVLNNEMQTESNGIAPFSTARTHVSLVALSQGNGSYPKSPVKFLVSQQNRLCSPSPRRAAGVRHFSDIAEAEASQPRGSADAEIDLDGLLEDVITTEDQQVMKVLSSPRAEHIHKRRKLIPRTPIEQELRDKPNNAASHSPPKVSPGIEGDSGMHECHTHQQSASVARKSSRLVGEQPSTILRDSTTRANEASLTTETAADAPFGTQDSVKRREAAGASAVSQLLSSNRTKKKGDVSQASEKVNTRHTKKSRSITTKSVDRVRRSRKAAPTSRSTAKSRMTVDAPVQTGRMEDDLLDQQDVSMQDAVDAIEVTDNTESPAVVAPNRIFAFFKGRDVKYNNYYPATWLGIEGDSNGFRVRFDDDTVTTVPPDQVCNLALRVGDSVRELHLDGHVQACVIQGFGPVAQTDQEHALGTDQYGRAGLKVLAKAAGRRISTPVNGAPSSEQTERKDILLTNIYLTRNMWSHFKDRVFTPPPSKKINGDRAETPVSAVRSSEEGTPGSRVRRSGVAAGNMMNASRLREGSVTSMASRSTYTLFAGMAFALSFGRNDAEKKSITQQIQRNGGIILEDEFDKLFDLLDCEASTNTTSNMKCHTESKDSPAAHLKLKPQYQNLGFVALITDSHSRRAKYIQAISLGLPTLSGRWIHDSVNPTKNVTLNSISPNTLDWAKYLLPAGESSYLGNVVRSRTIPIYPAASARLADTIANRDILLDNAGVLLVVPRKGAGNKALWQRHKQFAFLTLALGAGAVQRIEDLAEAKNLLRANPEQWKWVYVDGDVVAASWQLSGKKGAKPKAKSKTEFASYACGNGVTVVGDEFVIQSLILGALID